MVTARIWSDPPPMEVGAPMPHVKTDNDRLLVAYICRNTAFPGYHSGVEINHRGFEVFSAILQFSGVEHFTFGPPSEATLFEHPLYLVGVRPYGFYEIVSNAMRRVWFDDG